MTITVVNYLILNIIKATDPNAKTKIALYLWRDAISKSHNMQLLLFCWMCFFIVLFAVVWLLLLVLC